MNLSFHILKSFKVLFSRPDLYYSAYRIYKDLSVSDLSGVQSLLCGLDNTFKVTLSLNQIPNTTRIPETATIIAAPAQSVTSHGAVIATRPAREALRHIETSGFPYFIQVNARVIENH